MSTWTLGTNLVGVYGGTFDPPTLGHLQVVKKACNIVNKLYVVVAQGGDKKPIFTTEQRKAMLNDTMSGYQVEIVELPQGVFLSTYALKLGGDILVRGLRDEFDFHYEQQLYQTNKRIEPSLETIYIMPDMETQMVSSSWVKSLVGHGGWRDAIKPFVSPLTLHELGVHYAKQRFMKVIHNPILALDKNVNWDAEGLWQQYFASQIEALTYHNVFHILDCLESMDYYAPQKGPVMEFAFWMHDILPCPKDSAIIASSVLGKASMETSDKVAKLIRATQHTENTTGELDTEDEQIFASIDLLPLGSSQANFAANGTKIYQEYRLKSPEDEVDFMKTWVKGRTNFFQEMLSRRYIYPWKIIRDRFEATARSNMTEEAERLKSFPDNTILEHEDA